MPDSTPSIYDIDSYQYHLPPELIAQKPVEHRDTSKLLCLDCVAGTRKDLVFSDIIDFFSPGDLLVVNNTKVFPARIVGRKESGGRVELLALGYPRATHTKSSSCSDKMAQVEVEALLKSSKRPKPGQKIIFADNFYAVVVELLERGKVRLILNFDGNFDQLLDEHGQMPLPPYIKREEGQTAQDRERYQTVFASEKGAVAAPTAGLHFTRDLLDKIEEKGVERVSVTLHVGYGTFAPVRVADIREHDIHSEFLSVSEETAAKINSVQKSGGRIWAVGTTTVRALEFAASDDGTVHAKQGWCNLYIYPGYRFKVVKNLITNFHLPGSSLLFMVSALAGRRLILDSYNHAVKQNYRFFSYGDAMVIFNSCPVP